MGVDARNFCFPVESFGLACSRAHIILSDGRTAGKKFPMSQTAKALLVGARLRAGRNDGQRAAKIKSDGLEFVEV